MTRAIPAPIAIAARDLAVAFILIIDSNERHASRASEVLTSAGHACGQVASAEQAIALLRGGRPT